MQHMSMIKEHLEKAFEMALNEFESVSTPKEFDVCQDLCDEIYRACKALTACAVLSRYMTSKKGTN